MSPRPAAGRSHRGARPSAARPGATAGRAARVHVEAAAQDEAVDAVEKGVDFGFFAKRRHDDRQAAGGQDGVEVAGVERSAPRCVCPPERSRR